MTYCVARIPQAILLSGQILKDKRLKKTGKDCLDFVTKTCFDENGMFHARQNPNGGEQPIEAAVAVEVYVDAHDITKDNTYKLYAKKAFDWFHNENFARQNLIATNGAVYDAITKKGRLNTNCGAESIITYIAALGKIINLK